MLILHVHYTQKTMHSYNYYDYLHSMGALVCAFIFASIWWVSILES